MVYVEKAMIEILKLKKISKWLPGFIISLIIGLKSIIFSISYTSLIFSGLLAPYFPQGIGIALFSCLILSFIISKKSGIPDIVAQPQHVVSALLAIMAGSVASTLHSQGLVNQILPTVIVLIALSSFLLGAFFIALGYFRLGRLVRYVPYPVIAGLIAGIGLMIVERSLSIMSDTEVTFSKLGDYRTLLHILPGVFFGIVLYIFSKFYPIYALPILLISSILLFYGIFIATGIPVTQDWLINPLPKGHLWPPIHPSELALVNWSLIASQSGNIIVLIMTGVLYFLLTTTGLELVIKKDINIDKELRVTGLANFIASLGGGLAGYQTLILSSFSYRMGAIRHVGLIGALLALGGLLFNIGIFLNYLPKSILGGLVLFFGLILLMEWGFHSKNKMPLIDYILVLVIVAVIAVFDFMTGVITGMAIAVALFIFNYSKTNVIKYAVSGEIYPSNVDRPLIQREILHAKGDQIYIIKLQGFIFFGTAFSLLEKIKNHLSKAKSDLRYLVLDFHLVIGIDSSAVFSFIKLSQIAKTLHLSLVFTDVKPEIRRQLEVGGYKQESDETFRFFKSIDYGIEWCEDQLLLTEKTVLKKQVLPYPLDEMLPYLDKIEYQAGESIIRQGDPSKELYYIFSGKVSVLLELSQNRNIRLRSLCAGTFIGELGFYLDMPRSTSVVAEEPTVLYLISKKKIQNLKTKDPLLLLAFHESVARMLSERVMNTNKTIEALI